ncbi:unnamed protein product [Bursaphelenchus xylophilus]|uniref:(pine wood nematode) hypothetical protein n=1 Tax=Bursaphelenchus xylophilus TaxID=6326 RepID=A0A1I7S5F8_BURXY|nr:unnamed protein product [Bursaphelenchus xylophilus]CAG9118028.1 unnamed protein product [Bursaphelenchus xylophilus]
MLNILIGLSAVSLALATGFNETLAKEKFLVLAESAYTDWPEKCLKKNFGEANVTKTVTTKCGTKLGEWRVCYGYTGVSHKEKAVFLAYRGTISGIQLFYEVARTAFVKEVDAKIGGKVAAYFYTVYNNLRKGGLNAEFVRLTKAFPGYDVWISGHSLGGALASIATAEAIKVDGIKGDKVKLITFGEPRTGDAAYSKRYDDIVKYGYRVINSGDIVAQVPPKDFKGYAHHKTEVWYPHGMSKGSKYQVYTENESAKGFNSRAPLNSVSDHMKYYGKLLVQYRLTGC